MKFFKAAICTISFLLIVTSDHGTGKINQQETKNISADVALCRNEIERIIDSAMELGDHRGIALITNAINNYNTCLSPDDSSIGNLFHKGGVLYYINNSYNDAIRWFNKALPIREKHVSNSLEPLLNTLNGLTQSHLQLFHYDTAEQLIERQLTLIEKNVNTYDETKADLYLADAQLAFVIEDYTRCLEKLTIASKLYESVNQNTFNHGVVLNMLGATTDLLDLPAEAVTYYQRAIQIFELNQDLYFKALCFHNMGMAYAKLNQTDTAIYFLSQSQKIHLSYNDTIELARHYIEMAKIETAGNQFEKAKLLAQTSLMLREKMLPEWHADVIESQLVLGNILIEEAKQQKHGQKEADALALSLFDKALLAAIKSPRNERAIEPMANKAMLFANRGIEETEMAIKAHNLFLQADSMIQLSRLHYRQQESKIEFTRKIRNTYEHAIKNALRLYRITHKKEYFETALAFCEKSKATAIRDKFHKQAVQAFAGIPDSLLKQERQLNLQLGAATQTLISIKNKSDAAYYITLKSLEDVKHKMEEFDESLEENFPRYYNWLREPEEIAALTDIQQALKQGSILIEYFLGSEQIYVFSVSGKNYQSWVFANNDTAIATLNNYRQSIESSTNIPSSAICENAFKAYQLLLEQPLNFFNEKNEVTNLKIVPDGIIGNIPFDALMTSNCKNINADAPYLVKKYSHSFLYSNRLLLDKTERKQWFGKKDCAIFGINYSGNKQLYGDSVYSRLPFIEEEILSVQKLNGGELYFNVDATVTQLEEKLNDSEILHIAVHGSFNEDKPNASGLIFSKQNVGDKRSNTLTLAAIYGLHTKAQFIYLSSCFSGKGILAASEGVMSLSRAFTYAGVKSQVITLWEVSDRASAIIAKSFYEHLKNGKTKDDALRLAKLNYIEQSSTAIGQNPFFWAGSVVVGNAEPLYGNTLITWSVTIIILLIFITAWIWRKNHPKAQQTIEG